MARSHIFCRLYNVGVKRGPGIVAAKIQTERSTPIPANTAPAGGNVYAVTLGYISNDYGLDFRDVLR